MNKLLLTVVMVTIAVTIQACAMELGNEPLIEEDTDLSDVALVKQPLAMWYERIWMQGDKTVTLGSASDRFCYLSVVQGHFEGHAEWVQVWVKNGSWYLGGGSNQKGVGARAQCVPLTWNGRSYGYTKQYYWNQDNGSSIKIDGDGNHQTCFLTGVTGDFDGKGERVQLSLETVVSQRTWYLGGSSNQKHVAATARCLTNTAIPRGPYYWKQGEDPKIMNSTNDHACGLTKMTGKFDGSGEYLIIKPIYNSWYLTGGSKQKDVAGAAFCAY